MTTGDIAEQLEKLIETGTEEEVRAFVIDHFAEFPAQTQQELSVELLQEALEARVAIAEGMLGMKEKAVEAIDEFERLDKGSN